MTDATAIIVAGSIAAAVAGIPAIIAAVKVGRVEKNVNGKIEAALKSEYAKGHLQGVADERARAGGKA